MLSGRAQRSGLEPTRGVGVGSPPAPLSSSVAGKSARPRVGDDGGQTGRAGFQALCCSGALSQLVRTEGHSVFKCPSTRRSREPRDELGAVHLDLGQEVEENIMHGFIPINLKGNRQTPRKV